MTDSKTETPEIQENGEVYARYLIPLWTWLAILTVSVAAFFHFASQGSPIGIAFGVTVDKEIKYGRAGMWGVLFLAPCVLLLYALTLTWMRRRFAEQPLASRWEHLPAPVFWQLPTTDGVTRRLRIGVWLLVFVLPMVSLVHLAKKQLQTEFYQDCGALRDTQLDGCHVWISAGMGTSATPAIKNQSYRAFAAAPKSNGQRLHEHLSLSHLAAPDYFDHGFRFAEPSGHTYFPGLQAWFALAAIALAFWLWLRIVLSAVMRRMVLESPLTSLRRMARWRAGAP